MLRYNYRSRVYSPMSNDLQGHKYYCDNCLNEVNINADISFNNKTGEIENCCVNCGGSEIIVEWKKRLHGKKSFLRNHRISRV